MTDVSSSTVSFTNGTARTLLALFSDYVSVPDFVLSSDPSGDFTAAFRRALATGKCVYVPASPTPYLITDMLTVSTKGQVIFGEAGSSIIQINGTWNGNATAVITFDVACSESNAGIHGLQIDCVQPTNVSSRTGLTPYPFIISAPSVARLKFGHLKISNAWNGMNLQGNTGGLLAENLEIGTFNIGISAGGALDWWNIGSLTFYPFGVDSTNNSAYYDAENVAFSCGRIDGLNIQTMNVLGTQVVISTTDSVAGFGHIGILSLDTNARADFIAGNFNIGCWSATSNLDRYSLHVGGSAAFTFGPGRLLANPDSSGNPAVLVDGSATANFGAMICDNCSVSVSPIVITNGSLLMDAPVFLANHGNRTAAYVTCTGGRLSLRHPKFPDVGNSTGYAVNVANDEWHDIVVNQTVGWPVSLPASKTLGTYVVHGVKQ